jgi:flagellar FliJ protein
MKPFRFQLQPILSLKQQAEQTARERYAATLRACEEAAARLQHSSQELTECWTGLCQKLTSGVASGDLLRARAWCNVLELRVKERGADLEKARHAVDAVWQELMAATREREGLDRLREKRHDAYNRTAQAAGQKELDELALELINSPASLRVLANPTGR